MNQVFIGVGSNKNHPYFRIYSVLKQINRLKSTFIVKKSSLYETKPLGPQGQPNFINAVIEIKTNSLYYSPGCGIIKSLESMIILL